MMKKIALISLLALGAIGCSQTAQAPANSNANVQTTNSTTTVSSHAGETAPPVSTQSNSGGSQSSPGGSPMAKPIDTSQMTAEIEKAEKVYKSKPNDEKAKNDLAEAYFVRAFALTEAAQYRAALGDFRKGLKLNPNNADAKGMHDQIINIFQSIGREPPKEGEEPAPLPFNGSSEKPANSGSERIVFPAGATTATATGTLKNYDDAKTFVIKVNAGQTLKTEQAQDSNHITVGIDDPSGKAVGDSDASCNNRKEIKPTVAGDYTLKVTECKKADSWNGNFKLTVSVK